MNIAVQIPLKHRSSTRVPNKNFRELSGKPLCFWLLDELHHNCPSNWDYYVDSEDEAVMDAIRERYGNRFKFNQRHSWYSHDDANGNHLLTQFSVKYPQYDLFLQIHVTAVTLTGQIINESVDRFINNSQEHDSLLHVTEECGWYWFQGNALNYKPNQPDGLPRSQDAKIYKETTGLYGVTRKTIFKNCCRIGSNPLFHEIDRKYAIDIDTMEDFREAEKILDADKARKNEITAKRGFSAKTPPPETAKNTRIKAFPKGSGVSQEKS